MLLVVNEGDLDRILKNTQRSPFFDPMHVDKACLGLVVGA